MDACELREQANFLVRLFSLIFEMSVLWEFPYDWKEGTVSMSQRTIGE